MELDKEKRSELRKLQRNYDRAEIDLRVFVKETFPVGTRIKCRLTGNHYIVKEGSLYADQVMTNLGHVGVSHIEIIETVAP